VSKSFPENIDVLPEQTDANQLSLATDKVNTPKEEKPD